MFNTMSVRASRWEELQQSLLERFSTALEVTERYSDSNSLTTIASHFRPDAAQCFLRYTKIRSDLPEGSALQQGWF